MYIFFLFHVHSNIIFTYLFSKNTLNIIICMYLKWNIEIQNFVGIFPVKAIDRFTQNRSLSHNFSVV